MPTPTIPAEKSRKTEISSEKIFDFPELILISDFSCVPLSEVSPGLEEYRQKTKKPPSWRYNPPMLIGG